MSVSAELGVSAPQEVVATVEPTTIQTRRTTRANGNFPLLGLSDERVILPCRPDEQLSPKGKQFLIFLANVFEIPKTSEALTSNSFDKKLAGINHDHEDWKRYEENFLKMAAKTWGISLTNGENDEFNTVKERCTQAFEIASESIQSVEEKILGSVPIRERNEVRYQNDAISLLQLYFKTASEIRAANNEQSLEEQELIRSKKVLIYEIVRKFSLFEVAGNILANNPQSKSEKALAEFTDFLSESFWISNPVLMSAMTYHNKNDFKCSVFPLPKSDLVMQHELEIREFVDNDNNKHRVSYKQDVKTNPSKLLKLLREEKKTTNGLDDHQRFSMVFESYEGIIAFLEKLQSESGGFVSIDDIKDSIKSGEFEVTKEGSSNKLKVYKCNLTINNVVIEFQGYLLDGYIDSKYSDDSSWDIFMISRFCGSRIKDLLYPSDLYEIDWKQVKKDQINEIKKRNRNKAEEIQTKTRVIELKVLQSAQI